MSQYFPVTNSTFEALLNRVAEETLKADAMRKVKRLDRLAKIHNWLVARMVNARSRGN